MTLNEKIACILAGFYAILLGILWIVHQATKKYNKED